MLAPAVGISAVGLLLLGLSNRYSSIINRIRLLNEERRKYSRMLSQEQDLPYTDNMRLMSIATQVKELLIRSRYVRNAILWMQAAIALFVITSTGIGVNLFFSGEAMRALPLVLFICGMIAVVVGIVFAGMEVHRSYRIVLLEVEAES
ncbi:MAG: hypothetical protein HW412_1083 [Bacteroidetes bacterium]|nr:hypothetical protein [Bacteroidota bacterium]